MREYTARLFRQTDDDEDGPVEFITGRGPTQRTAIGTPGTEAFVASTDPVHLEEAR